MAEPDDHEQVDHNAKPAGIVRFEGKLTEDEFNALAERWRREMANVANILPTLIGEGDEAEVRRLRE